MPIHYHIERAEARSLIRKHPIKTDWNRNLYSNQLLSQEIRITVPGVDKMPLNLIVRDHFDPDSLGLCKRIKSDEDVATLLAQLAVPVMEHQAKMIREYIFEEVRSREFACKPSRLKGVWLLPHDEHVLELWCADPLFKKFRVWEVEAAGVFHHGYTKYLEPHAVGGATVLENARRYWSETPPANLPASEILFEGELMPLREVKAAVGKPNTWNVIKAKFGWRGR